MLTSPQQEPSRVKETDWSQATDGLSRESATTGRSQTTDGISQGTEPPHLTERSLQTNWAMLWGFIGKLPSL